MLASTDIALIREAAYVAHITIISLVLQNILCQPIFLGPRIWPVPESGLYFFFFFFFFLNQWINVLQVH